MKLIGYLAIAAVAALQLRFELRGQHVDPGTLAKAAAVGFAIAVLVPFAFYAYAHHLARRRVELLFAPAIALTAVTTGELYSHLPHLDWVLLLAGLFLNLLALGVVENRALPRAHRLGGPDFDLRALLTQRQVVLGLVLLGSSAGLAIETFVFERRAERQSAQVKELLPCPSFLGRSCATVALEPSQESRTATLRRFAPPAYRVDERLPVLVDPEDPSDVREPNPRALWFWPLIVGLASLLLLVRGYAAIRTNAPRAEPAE